MKEIGKHYNATLFVLTLMISGVSSSAAYASVTRVTGPNATEAVGSFIIDHANPRFERSKVGVFIAE